jgi:hypothetical protein
MTRFIKSVIDNLECFYQLSLINTVGLFLIFNCINEISNFEFYYLYVCPYTALLQGLTVLCLRHLAILIEGWCTEGL